MMLFPTPNGILKTFNESRNGGFYRETYRLLDKETRENINEVNWKEIEETVSEEEIIPIKEGGRWRIKIKLNHQDQ